MAKKLSSLAILLCFAIMGFSQSSVYTHGYARKNGTCVQGYYRTSPNRTNTDNYSTKSNYNPCTGNTGYRAKDYSAQAQNYGNGRTVYQGGRGGQYYYNGKGNKVYVPKRQ